MPMALMNAQDSRYPAQNYFFQLSCKGLRFQCLFDQSEENRNLPFFLYLSATVLADRGKWLIKNT